MGNIIKPGDAGYNQLTGGAAAVRIKVEVV